MNFLCSNDDLSDEGEFEDMFGVNTAVNANNEGIEVNVPNGGRIPALPGIPIPRNGGIDQQHLPWTGGRRDPALRMTGPKTALCYRHMLIQRKVF